ncbi:hypothetical protein AMELA_G00203800 [Ameiurus melas]|uniref:Uncharacterized protein n=1 Tax=Ameiurus melas TaxID=219545 RepID=A0A7J6A2G7_AMEME|nr:hypothetical protein AMELA_G00203800 [Ameiurus melas]
MRHSAYSLASQRGGTELNLREYALERHPAVQTREKERDRAHQHHHHHRCHRRRDKKHKSLDRAISEEQPQPGSVDTTADLSNEPRERARERERDRGRSHERKHHSSSATDRKQRYYSCDRYGNVEHCHSRSPGPSRSTSPGDPQEPTDSKRPCRGRRQLPQTPLTPRPALSFKSTSSSTLQMAATRSSRPVPTYLSRRQSEHDALLSITHQPSPVPVTRIGSDSNLGPLQRHPYLSEAD